MCRTRTCWKRDRKRTQRRIECDTIQVYILCPLAQGIYGRKERAHRNPFMEPDYLFAPKLIECRAERERGRWCVCVCLCERVRYLVLFILFSIFKQILLCLHRERQMGWGLGVGRGGLRGLHERVWLCSSRGLLLEL